MKRIAHANIACGFHAGDLPGCGAQSNGQNSMASQLVRILGFLTSWLWTSSNEYHPPGGDQLRRLPGWRTQSILHNAWAQAARRQPHGAFYSWSILSEDNARAVLEGFQAIDPTSRCIFPHCRIFR